MIFSVLVNSSIMILTYFNENFLDHAYCSCFGFQQRSVMYVYVVSYYNKSISVPCVFKTSGLNDIIVKCAMGYLRNSFV